MQSPRKPLLFVRKESWVPTWRLWVLLAALISAGFFVFLFGVHPFLAVSNPVKDARILVATGWLADAHVAEVRKEFERGNYDKLCVVGGPIEKGHMLVEYESWAELTAAGLRKLGFPEANLLVASSDVGFRNRTYHSAVALKRELASEGIRIDAFNLCTEGVHARRSFLIYRKVFGDRVKVGVVNLTPLAYDPKAWWKSSQGAKMTITELIGWLYEWLLNSGR